MISSEEFKYKLQAGSIHEALALVLHDAIELNVTTRLSEELGGSANDGDYLHTRIDLLTGEIQNEVGKDLLIAPTTYLKLQQLHIDRIVADYQIFCGYLEQIHKILAVLPPSSSDIDSTSATKLFTGDRLTADSLAVKLTQAMALLTKGIEERRSPVETLPSDGLTVRDAHIVGGALTIDSPQERLCLTAGYRQRQRDNEDFEITPTEDEIYATAVDENLDLDSDSDGEVWEEYAEVVEEWLEEDEEFGTESFAPQPPANLPTTAGLGWENRPQPRNFDPIEVKPIVPRAATPAVDPAIQWDRFEPEYIGIRTDDRLMANRKQESFKPDLDP